MSLGTGPTNGGRSDVDTIPPQPTVLVAGSADHQLRPVATELFDERSSGGDGAVVVTTRESPVALVDRLTGDPGGLDPGHLAVVDARGADEGDEPAVGWLRRVDPGVAPDAMGASVTDGLSWLADGGVDRRHFLYDALAADYRGTDGAAIYDRAYEVAMTVGVEDGLALFALDADGLPEEYVEELGHLFDVQVELRDGHGATELRWTGLVGASEGWLPLREADLGPTGFR